MSFGSAADAVVDHAVKMRNAEITGVNRYGRGGLMRALETERLDLRPLDEGDEELYCRIYTDAELMRHVGEPLKWKAASRAFTKVCQLNRKIEFRYRCWVVTHRQSGEKAGILGMVGNREQAEIGGMILPAWQGCGVSGETFPAGVDVAFGEYKVNKVVVRYRTGNVMMEGLMRKLPFSMVTALSCGDGWVHWMQTRKDWKTRMHRQAPTHGMYRSWEIDSHTVEDQCKQEA